MKKVFVGMSGGVDSSVAALLLKEAGYDVVGVFIKGWYPDFLECSWRDDRRDAMRVAAKLDIPFLTIDAEEEYKREVIDYLLREYKAGRTPNPDSMCNQYVKFGVFFQEAMRRGADFIATGHYAAKPHESTLRIPKDVKKDQTYFLWSISPEALSKTLFPLESLLKEEVREIAVKHNLVTAHKKDSQGICFLGDVSMKEFLSHYIQPKRGDVLNTRGEVIGYHNGALFFTLGERRGFVITKKGTDDLPYFVVDKNMENNTITVSHERVSSASPKNHSGVLIENTHFFNGPPQGEPLLVRFRHGQELIPVLDYELKDGGGRVTLVKQEETPSPGQSLVLYTQDGVCLGGGSIYEA